MATMALATAGTVGEIPREYREKCSLGQWCCDNWGFTADYYCQCQFTPELGGLTCLHFKVDAIWSFTCTDTCLCLLKVWGLTCLHSGFHLGISSWEEGYDHGSKGHGEGENAEWGPCMECEAPKNFQF